MRELCRRERGRLWLRLGVRLGLLVVAIWAGVRLGPTAVSLFAPFLLAFGAACGLAPAVRWLNRRWNISRKFLSLALLVLVFVTLGGAAWGLLAGLAGEVMALAGDWEGLVESLQGAVDSLGEMSSRAVEGVPAAARETAEGLVDQFFRWLETVIPRAVTAGVDLVTDVARALPSFAVATVVFVMATYFITADFPHLRAALADKLPRGPRVFLSIVKRTASAGFGGYVKAEVILSVGVFLILLAGFLLIGQPYALLLALGLAVLDFIPILGAGTVMLPWAAMNAITGELRHGVGLMVVWGLVALFRRVAEPKVLGDQTGLSPILSLVSVYVGMRLGGVAGMVLGPVVCLVARNIVRSGVLDNAMGDVRLAFYDVCALLKGGQEGETENFETEISD